MPTSMSSYTDRTADQYADQRGQRRPTRQPYRCRPIHDALPDYKGWSVEELRVFAAQMQVPEATRMSRSELLALFDVSAASKPAAGSRRDT